MLSNGSVGNAIPKGRTSGEGTSSNAVEAPNPTLDHLRTFLHLTTQAPLETVCRASLHVLAHVPAARQAVLEYLSTFYKVATFLHLRYNLNVKNSQYGGGGPSPADLITEANNLIQINMAIEMMENALDEMLTNAASTNELWSIELTHWLADMIGDIVANTASTCADSIPGLSAEEIASFKSPTINDGLEIWSKQSKPAQSILQLIHKSFKSAKSETTRSKILDILLEISGKYPKKYDWVLAYFSCLNTELMLKKLLALELKEFSQPSSSLSSTLSPQKPPQSQAQSQAIRSINVISFYAKSYPKVTCEQIVAVLSDTTQETDDDIKIINRIIFVLRLATQSPPLLIVLLEQVLDSTSPYHETLVRALKSIVNTDVPSHRAALFACLNQINNSIGVFEIILNILDALSLRNRPFNEFLPKICQYSILYLEELISSIYFTQSNPIETASDSIGFLRSLNQMDGHSLEALQNSMIQCLKIITTTKRDDNKNDASLVDEEKRKKLQVVQTTLSDELELIYRLFVVMMINTNEFKAGAFMRRLLTLDETTMQRAILNNDVNNKISLLASLDEGILVKIRQEIAPFHENCFADAVKSLVNYLTEIESDEEQLAALVRNMISVHDWDIQNRCSMNRNLSSIILERECFVGLMSQLKADKTYSLQIMELYNRIFKLDDDDLGPIKLTIPDLYRCANSFVDYFFELTTSINESNVLSRVNQINELTVLVENIICEHFRSWDDNSPFRNMLLRHLIERIFETLSANDKKNSSNDSVAAYDAFDENANLFNSNIQAINEEFLSNKSRLKAVRNSLIDEEFIKRSRTQIKNELKNLRNWALIDLFEAICSTKGGDLERRRKLKSELLGYLADLLVQHILVEQHFVDYQWSTIQLAIEVEESLESELESIKMFVERDMFVQNKVENSVDNQVIWLLLELIASDEQAFIKVGPIIRSLLASLIIQWEALPETPTRNIPKTLGITTRLLNTINRVSNFMPNPLCLIVDIVPILNSYETFISLMVIWRNLKRKMLLSISKPPISITTESNKVSDLKHLRYIFQKNINKLAPLYAQFFKP